jgi:predicted esterase
MKIKLIVIILVFSYNLIFSQCNGRYMDEIFSSVTTTTVNYSDQLQYQDSFHEMDIYTPVGDTVKNRPLIIFIHGGSYLGGSKAEIDCIDFCEHFAKKGYVTASVNYRLSANQLNFVLYEEEQYLTVWNSVADVKAAIRYFRKDYSNGNNYGIDQNTIFVGGSSAGAVTAVHLAYINNVSDLPNTSSPNGTSIQTLVNNSGGLEGDVGNSGFSSEISAVINFSGAINTTNWIEVQEQPIVSVHGTADQTIDFYCAPGLGIPTVLNLCGSSEIHNQANNIGLLNDLLVFDGGDHDWFQSGNADSRFIQALNFVSSFIYPLLSCNQITISSNLESSNYKKKLVQKTNLLGQKNGCSNTMSLFYYNDGTVEKRILVN